MDSYMNWPRLVVVCEGALGAGLAFGPAAAGYVLLATSALGFVFAVVNR